MPEPSPTRPSPRREEPEREGPRRFAPAFEVIPLDCEISGYAPQGDDPLF